MEMLFITHIILFVVLICMSGATQTCYDCTRVPYTSDCDHVISCSDDSSCYVEEIVTDSGVVVYNTGCQSKFRCHNHRRNILVHGRAHADDVVDDITGDIIVCNECCQGDYCNSQGCNSKPLPPLSSRGPVCYSCHQQASHNICDILKVCDQGENCFMSPQYSATGHKLFTTGCRKHIFCQALLGVPVGRRGVPDCTGCCSEDYCNRNCSTLHQHRFTPPTLQISTTQVTVPTHTTILPQTLMQSTTRVTHRPTTHVTSPAPVNTPKFSKKLCEMLGYTYNDVFNKCYKVYNNIIKTWQESRDQCKQDGGDLIVFNSMAEKIYFADQARNLNRADLPRFWVGATDQNTHNAWRWVDDRPIDHEYFHPGEPNHDHGEEHCATLAQFLGGVNISMNDDRCSVQTSFMCEISPQSIFTTPPASSSPPCRNHDYEYLQDIGMCYKIYKDIKKTQIDARSFCRSQSADLLILRNFTVEHFFQAKHFYENDEQQRYWLGGERIPNDVRNQHDSFRWYNGHTLDPSLDWFGNQPDNYKTRENCLTFSYFSIDQDPFALNDEWCSEQHQFICEERCPDVSYQYFSVLDLCFKVYDEHVTWSEARDRCRQEKMDLLELDTTEKLTFFEMYLNLTNNGDAEKFWVGARDDNHDRTYEWLTSLKVVPSTFWHKTEPSVLSANEHCAALHFFPQDHRLLMNDLNCNTNKIRFICQDIW